MKLIRYLWRTFRWWFRCLWEGKKVPRVLPGAPYARHYMRKAWKERIQALDRKVNFNFIRGIDPTFLLYERHIMVAKRRVCRFE
jgi:hypothetical protein